MAVRGPVPVLASKVYVNSCSQGALSDAPVRAAYEEYLDGWDANGAEWEFWVERAEAIRGRFAELVVVDADEVAIQTSVSAVLEVADEGRLVGELVAGAGDSRRGGASAAGACGAPSRPRPADALDDRVAQLLQSDEPPLQRKRLDRVEDCPLLGELERHAAGEDSPPGEGR